MEAVVTVKDPVLAGAGIWRRVFARIIDLVLHNLLVITTMMFTAMVLGFFLGAVGADVDVISEKFAEPHPLDLVFPLLGYLLYHSACEGFHGATLGKLALGIHVLSEEVTPCTLAMALKRSLGWLPDMFFLGLVGIAMMASSNLRQRLGDRWARTIVVQKSRYPSLEFPSGGRFLLAFTQGLLVDVLVVGFMVGAKILLYG